ncbi:SUKH-3 domain-containing protein [Streptomyces thermodiastaticus]|uniref:SUKH-3 domain-containing protein n=2 Tax=Streptomyces thermodiastaticus TaxID=44061 RepID=UPI001672A9E6|nr:SUKH-3 domain-containing protein [Streptomyces thermodiastaticus]MCE7552933.1 SUKH-3 domain-containing protein [Streptomyces thermodiastaticus]GHF89257.1 hypothetical protein GCM10018787_42390 [Streptomyces thermodiastaticus]
MTAGPTQQRLARQDGWYEGRGIDAEAEHLIDIRLRNAREQGVVLAATDPAVRVIRSYGGLRLKRSAQSEGAWGMEPTVGYRNHALDIKELAEGLGAELFPVGYEYSDFGVILVDERGRFFLLQRRQGKNCCPGRQKREPGSD